MLSELFDEIGKIYDTRAKPIQRLCIGSDDIYRYVIKIKF